MIRGQHVFFDDHFIKDSFVVGMRSKCRISWRALTCVRDWLEVCQHLPFDVAKIVAEYLMSEFALLQNTKLNQTIRMEKISEWEWECERVRLLRQIRLQ